MTKIEWCDFTFNCWRGCTKVSEGCKHCYAETQTKRYAKSGTVPLVQWGDNGTRVVKAESGWAEPLKWNREAEANGERPRVFCASLSDVFEDWQGPMVDAQGNKLYDVGTGNWMTAEKVNRRAFPGFDPDRADGTFAVTMQCVRRRLFELIDQTPNLDWLLLTKRPENVLKMMPEVYLSNNVWIGTTVENQQAADERIPHLLKVPAAVRFLSCEPLLGEVNLDQWLPWCCDRAEDHRVSPCPNCREYGRKYEEPGIHWVICGGESGPGARPMHPQWARSLHDQCQAAGVRFFFKQWGEWSPRPNEGRETGDGVFLADGRFAEPYQAAECGHDITHAKWMYRVGKKAAGRMLDGREWNEFPKAGGNAERIQR